MEKGEPEMLKELREEWQDQQQRWYRLRDSL
jgi:hypothetical protein